ncbi:MAG: hypothetical protein QY330_04270 [Candidatus Dojkabacteria bacterium]|nr:MAG: hypothetical protein QY330_04270 [Candidatus Dojkabacteria bacterium]
MRRSIQSIESSGVGLSTHIARYNFPARSDYEQYYMSGGQIQSPEELWQNNDYVADVQRHWHTKGQNGCVFAQRQAIIGDGWNTHVVSDPLETILGEDILGDIPLVVANAINDPSIEVVSLLFPQVRTSAELVVFLKALRSTKPFTVGREDRFDDYTALGLRFPISDEVTAWIVGFAPFPYLPITRQAPSLELAVRVKVKPEDMFYKLNHDQSVAHPADIPLQMDDEVAERLYTITVEKTAELLGGHDARKNNPHAKAKYTISVPTELWFGDT